MRGMAGGQAPPPATAAQDAGELRRGPGAWPAGAISPAGRKPPPAFFTVEEVADVLRVDPVTIYRAIRAGEFPAVKIRKRYVVPQRAIEMLVDDAVATGVCVDAAEWTSSWRHTTGALVEVP
jgi:excisionase family DNA binding protein